MKMRKTVIAFFSVFVSLLVFDGSVFAQSPPIPTGPDGKPNIPGVTAMHGWIVSSHDELRLRLCPSNGTVPDGDPLFEKAANRSFCSAVMWPDVIEPPERMTVHAYRLETNIHNDLLMQGMRPGYWISRQLLLGIISGAEENKIVATDGGVNLVYVSDFEDRIWTVFFYRTLNKRWIVRGYHNPPGSWHTRTILLAQ